MYIYTGWVKSKYTVYNLNEVIPLCIDSIYSSQHNYIIKAYVKVTCFDLKSHRQAKLRTTKFTVFII